MKRRQYLKKLKRWRESHGKEMNVWLNSCRCLGTGGGTGCKKCEKNKRKISKRNPPPWG